MDDTDESAESDPGPSERASDAVEVRGEPRTPVIIGVLVAIVLPMLMPERYTPGPKWLFPVVVGGLLVAMLVADPGRIDRRSAGVRRIRMALIAALAAGAAWATIWLTVDLIRGGHLTKSAGNLLEAGALVLADVLTMGLQSVASLALIGLVIARAVNVLG